MTTRKMQYDHDRGPFIAVSRKKLAAHGIEVFVHEDQIRFHGTAPLTDAQITALEKTREAFGLEELEGEEVFDTIQTIQFRKIIVDCVE